MNKAWEEYQEEAAAFFRSLGLNAEVEARIKGVRGLHDIDVYVEGAYHYIEFKWIVECKAWKSNVPKEKAMALMSIFKTLEQIEAFFFSHTRLSQSFGIGIIASISGQRKYLLKTFPPKGEDLYPVPWK